MWHWASGLDPPVYPPVPLSLNIGHWLWDDHVVDEGQWWIKAYACSLQCIAKASVGQFWTAEGEAIVLQVSNLVETFMGVTGIHISPHIIRDCWPLPQEETPQQDLNGIQEVIVHWLDEVATHCLLTTVWDRFTFPQTEEKYWKEEVLSHYLRKILDVGARMPGFKIMMQDKEGLYGKTTYALKFEGHMLIYNLQKDFAQLVPVRGVSTLLTSFELRLANDLNNMNPHPYDGPGLVKPHSPMLVQGIPVGEEESDTDSYGEPSDLGEEWDNTELGDWSHCPAPPWVEIPTWVEATAEVWRRVVIDKESPTWEEVICSSLQKKNPERKD